MFCCAVSFVQKSSAQWVDRTPADNNGLWQLELPDNDSLYIISYGSDPRLHRSYDGGLSWKTVSTPAVLSDPIIYHYLVKPGIAFLDGKTGYMYGAYLVNGGVFLNGTEATWIARTMDGGETWTDLDPILPDSGFAVPGMIKFFTPTRGVALLTSGFGLSYVKTTNDGGLSWQSHENVPVSTIDAKIKPDGTGVLLSYNISDFLGDPVLYKTADFGKHWTLAGPIAQTAPFLDLQQGMFYNFRYFHNANDGFQITSTGADPNNYTWHLSRTQDGGFNWLDSELDWQDGGISDFKMRGSVAWVMGTRKLYRRAALTADVTPANGIGQVSVFPNPVGENGRLGLLIPGELTGEFDVQITAADGRYTMQRVALFESGVAMMDCSDLPRGCYFLRILLGQNTLGIAKFIR